MKKPVIASVRGFAIANGSGLVAAGDIIPTTEAERLGIVNQVVPDDELETVTMELAKKLAKKSPLAIECDKQGIYGMSDLPYHQAVDYMGEMFAQLCATEDATEGLQAFQEKREPKWNRK